MKHKKGMPKSKESHHSEEKVPAHFFYAVTTPQRVQEVMDSRMIQEDHGSFSNLPRHGFSKTFDPNKYMESLGRSDERYDV